MFVINTVRRNILKHWKKSLLSITLSILIVLFLLLYIGNIEKNTTQISNLGKTIPVIVRVCNIDGSGEVGLQIDFEKLQKIHGTGLVTEEVYTTQTYAKLLDSSYEDKSARPVISYLGANSFLAFTAFHPKDVTFMKGYKEDILLGNEAVCVVRDKFMKEKNLKLGDELETAVFAPVYDSSGGETFVYKEVDIVNVKVIGSYYTNTRGFSDELPDIISPIGYVASIYEGTDIKCYASSARFTLNNPLLLNEFKKNMHDLGFKSVDMQKGFSRVGEALTMNDETFIMSATQLTKSLNLLKSFAPLIFAIVSIIGFISSYLLIQSRRDEFAIMRSLGISKKISVLIVFLESLVLVMIGSLLGILPANIIVGVRIETAGLVLIGFLIFYMLGNFFALILLNRFSVMAILSKAD